MNAAQGGARGGLGGAASGGGAMTGAGGLTAMAFGGSNSEHGGSNLVPAQGGEVSAQAGTGGLGLGGNAGAANAAGAAGQGAACEREQGEALLTCCNALLDPFVPEDSFITDIEGARAVPEIVACCGALTRLSRPPTNWGALMNCCYVAGHPQGICTPWGPPMPPEFELPAWLRGEWGELGEDLAFEPYAAVGSDCSLPSGSGGYLA